MKSKRKNIIDYHDTSTDKGPHDPIDRYLWEIDHGFGDAVNLSQREFFAWKKLKVYLGMYPYDEKYRRPS